MPEIENFMDEFDVLLKKYSIDDVILTNYDDDTMGFRQLVKIIEDEKKFLVLIYSGKNEILSTCCKEEHEKCQK